MSDKKSGEKRIGNGKPGPGRPKGSRNKTTMAAKAAIEQAAAELGGAERLVEWAQKAPENERAFWTMIYPKLLPLTGPGDHGEHEVVFRWKSS